MYLQDFFDDIALGDLQGSPVVELGGYKINPVHLPKVIQATNQALDYFYSTFPLKESQAVIKLRAGISRYYLDSDYAMSNVQSSNVKYIMDSDHEPFTNDVLNIESVFADTGEELLINDNFSQMGVTTPEYNCVQTTNGTHRFSYITVIYKAKHPRIPLNEPLDSRLSINIPASFNSALQSYVASLVYSSMGDEKGIQSAQFYYGKFKTLVEELKQSGVGYKSTLGINIKPILRNWI